MPSSADRVVFTVRMPPALRDAMESAAKAQARSSEAIVRDALMQYLGIRPGSNLHEITAAMERKTYATEDERLAAHAKQERERYALQRILTDAGRRLINNTFDS